LGHYFDLDHTFSGEGIELANGSNCSTAGDGICDTPADPYVDTEPVSDYVDGNCIFISKKKDVNGQFYDPDVSNIMGYYQQCRCLKFTHDQYAKMANHYLSNPTAW
jgi:hypothetical protein